MWRERYPKLVILDHRRRAKHNAELFVDCSLRVSPNCKGKRWLQVNSLRNAKTAGACLSCGSYKGGCIHKRTGYRLLTKIDGKQIWEHRYVMEKHLGRKLRKNETVHHRNGKRADNRVMNLEVRLAGNHPRGISPEDAIHWLTSLGYLVQKRTSY